MAFECNLAFVRGLPRSFPEGLALHPPIIPIDMDKARIQHDAYTSLIRDRVETVIEIPADEKCPDCVFIEVQSIKSIHARNANLGRYATHCGHAIGELSGVESCMAFKVWEHAHAARVLMSMTLSICLSPAVRACASGHESVG